MGTTFVHRDSGEPIADFFKREFDSPSTGGKVLDVAVVNRNEAYIAYGRGDRVFAIACILHHRPKDPDGFNFGYKDMDESMGPFLYNCPERILNLLTPTEYESARDWREKCRQRLAARRGKPKLENGDIVVFAGPISFTNGRTHSTFTVTARGRKVLFRGDDGVAYRITGWRDRQWAKIGQVSSSVG